MGRGFKGVEFFKFILLLLWTWVLNRDSHNFLFNPVKIFSLSTSYKPLYFPPCCPEVPRKFLEL